MVNLMLNGWYENNLGYLVHFINGKLHNLIAPAEISCLGIKCWYDNGKYNRLDGPAFENGENRAWWIKGKYFNFKCQKDFDRFLKLKLLW